MREIKFRIWDGNNGYFDYPDTLELNRGLEYEQYTGLKDKKGREIYEGDIVWRPRGHSREVVEFDYGFYPFDAYELEELGMPDADDCEVIGNIHENPELLKAQS